MNIVFEGINGTGKTSIINELVQLMKNDDLEVNSIAEINNISPVASALEKMYEGDTFMRMHETFDTVLVESLILAADYLYLQEYVKNLNGYNIFDRDFFTEIVYQQYFIEQVYGAENTFYENWAKCLTYHLKPINMVVFVDAPLEICIERTIIRDHTTFDEEKTQILIELHKRLKTYVINFCSKNNINLIQIDGTKDIKENALKIYNEILK